MRPAMAYQPLKLQHTVDVQPVGREDTPPSPIHHEHREYLDFSFSADEPAGFSSFDARAPQNGSRPVKHVPTWSSSTNTTAVTSESSSLKADEKSKTEKKQGRLLTNGTWKFEILALVVALGAIGAIIGVVFRYDGRALPDWPHDITLNALIALLATFANATISVCLSSGISQAKWIRFKRSAAPLSDMEAFDEASRGSWGSLKLLATAKGGYAVLNY
jgi:hypothetical protein